ncbi:single-stranded DNA-binding protein 4 isoform X7 [Eptesicus fuscus]|uniref:single-stranded DNA-binding protein 4 isoform X7 n=1 Tax=Eptesicus fuscus TaxID=29078 RepID=UPI0024047D8E|nr:single-stranded DNA-binding protein 4 isoform X7 [Eptesicus fuscus]
MYAKGGKSSAVPSDSQAREKLALYVYEYLLHIGAQKSAQTFLSEIRWEKNITLGEPPGFLHSWWCVFWDLYCAAPDRREACEHSSEAKAFQDYVSPAPGTRRGQERCSCPQPCDGGHSPQRCNGSRPHGTWLLPGPPGLPAAPPQSQHPHDGASHSALHVTEVLRGPPAHPTDAKSASCGPTWLSPWCHGPLPACSGASEYGPDAEGDSSTGHGQRWAPELWKWHAAPTQLPRWPRPAHNEHGPRSAWPVGQPQWQLDPLFCLLPWQLHGTSRRWWAPWNTHHAQPWRLHQLQREHVHHHEPHGARRRQG